MFSHTQRGIPNQGWGCACVSAVRPDWEHCRQLGVMWCLKGNLEKKRKTNQREWNMRKGIGDKMNIIWLNNNLGDCDNHVQSVKIQSGLWSLGTATTEPTCHNYWSLCALEPKLCNKKNHHNVKLSHHNYRVTTACWNQRKAWKAMKTQHSQK